MTEQYPPYFAAIDLGSNSFHMLIVRVNDDGTFEVIDRVKEMVQIARGLDNEGLLSEEAQQRAIHCLECFSERIREIPGEQIRAVGTKTLRAASNASSFLRSAEQALKHPIQIISGYEEARLVYLGVSNSIINDQRQRLVIDIGGGSTELIIGHDTICLLQESLSVGCVTYAERFLKEGVNRTSIRNAYLATCEELEAIRTTYCLTRWDVAFGASGTMKVIADLMPQTDNNAIITEAGLDALLLQTIENGEVKGTNITKLRRDVLPAGMAILKAIFDQLKISELHVADATLKEGLIYDTLGRMVDKDTRDQTVEKLLKQHHIDLEQAKRVETTARELLSQLSLSPAGTLGLPPAKLLSWASKLHEIGMGVSHSAHHHHGHYLLKHGDLAGFSRYEQQILATLVKCHRRKVQLDFFESVPPDEQQTLIPMLVCLRLAVLLCRRREPPEQIPRIHLHGNTMNLDFEEVWLKEHPLTYKSLEHEAEYLAPLGLALQF